MASEYKVLSRVGSIKIGAVGAAESACTEIGGCRNASYKIDYDENIATDADMLDIAVAAAFSGAKGSLSFTTEDINSYNTALAMGGTDETTAVYVSPEDISVPTYYTVYVRGSYLNGDEALWHVVKCYFKPSSEKKLGKEQQTLDLTATMMGDSTQKGALGYSMFAELPCATDTTPPTISTVSPADEATGVAKAATTLVVWTFSEAIRTQDVTASRFFVHADTGAVKAGTLSIGTNNTVVTFTPTTAWAATTKYHAVVVGGSGGVRDTAGNALAATSVTDFTTGS